MKVIVWKQPDGAVAVTHVAAMPSETEAETLQRVQAEEAPNFPGADVLIVEETELPDDAFFDAYAVVGNRIEIDLARARQIRLKTIAQVRDEILRHVEQDIFEAEAVRDVPRETAAKDRRLRLRDLARNIDLGAVNSVQDLRDYWPAELERRIAARRR